MAYATPANLKARYDIRRLGDLVTDDGTRATSAELNSDDNLQAALDDASGQIDSAVLRGGRYTQDDLTGLADTAAAFLVRLTCDLAYGMLVSRRGFDANEVAAIAPRSKWAEDILDKLAEGERIFNTEAAIAAGKPVRAVIDRRLQLVSGARRLFGDLTVNQNNPGNPTLTD